MELTFIADWLNKTFASFDYTILEKMHKLAESTAGALTPVFEFISLLAEKGIILFIIAVVLMCLKNTRKIGICMFIAIVVGVCSGIFPALKATKLDPIDALKY